MIAIPYIYKVLYSFKSIIIGVISFISVQNHAGVRVGAVFPILKGNGQILGHSLHHTLSNISMANKYL